MSTVKFNPIVDSFSKAMGNIVYTDYDGIPYVRRRIIPRDPKTAPQLEVREAFAVLSRVWRKLGALIQGSWLAVARKSRRKRMLAYAAFIKSNARKQRMGEPLVLCPGLAEEFLSSFSAAPGSAAGSIDCSFTRTALGEGRHITLFVHRRENGHANGELARIALGAGQQSPYTITNLETGSEYFVYAVLTDKALEEASTVSGSSSALASAR